MSQPASALAESVKTGASTGEAATQRPATSARSSSTSPMTDASMVRPGRMTRIQKPISIAMGMVQAMVKTPHGLPRSAFTTTSASTASRMIMMARIAAIVSIPVNGPISSRAIWPRDLPFRRTEPKRMMKSWTAPASTTPNTIQIVPGR
jgi:hypothetical protein